MDKIFFKGLVPILSILCFIFIGFFSVKYSLLFLVLALVVSLVAYRKTLVKAFRLSKINNNTDNYLDRIFIEDVPTYSELVAMRGNVFELYKQNPNREIDRL